MQYYKKIILVLIGTIILGLGISFTTISTLGQDPLSAMVFSLSYLIDLPFFSYSTCYIIINVIFFILIYIFLKDKLNIGSVINFLLTGIVADVGIYLLLKINIQSTKVIIQIIYSLIGITLMSIGVAIYGAANLGLAPYDALPLLITKINHKFKYTISRIIIAGACALIALIIGVLILKRTDLIHINTILSTILMSIQIPICSKIINKYLLKRNDITFE